MNAGHEAAYARTHAVLTQMFAGHDNPSTLASEVMAEIRRHGWRWMPREDPPQGRVQPSPPPEQWAAWRAEMERTVEERRAQLEQESR